MSVAGRILLLFLLLFCTPQPSEASAIESVSVRVMAKDKIPPAVQERMGNSVAAIAEQIFGGQDENIPKEALREKEALLREVFDKVLVGYTIEELSIQPAKVAKVKVRLVPWDDVIETVDCKIAVEGLPPEVEVMVRQDAKGLEKVFEESLVGLPLAAVDWTNGILKRNLKNALEKQLPEFRAEFDLDSAQHTEVRLMLYPRLPVIRTVDLSMRAKTLPNTFLLAHRAALEERTHLLLGVPVAFAARHQGDFETLFRQTLAEEAHFKSLRVTTDFDMPMGENTTLTSHSESERYRIRLIGWTDMCRDGGGRSTARLHVGQKISEKQEAFLRLEFRPEDTRWNSAVGYLYAPRRDFQAEARYEFRGQEPFLEARCFPLPKWGLRYAYAWNEHTGELGIRYKIHDFLHVEWIRDERDDWLRFIGIF